MRASPRWAGFGRIRLPRRLRRALSLAGGAAAFGFLALVFLGVALHAALAASLGPVWAAVLVALVSGLVAALLGYAAETAFGRAREDMAAALRSGAVSALVPLAAGIRPKVGAVGAVAALLLGFLAASRSRS